MRLKFLSEAHHSLRVMGSLRGELSSGEWRNAHGYGFAALGALLEDLTFGPHRLLLIEPNPASSEYLLSLFEGSPES